uniref:protein translocase subunit SecD n=1 Tax=Agathobacter sp. TaxID=2021311 RepID=UPI0040566985
MKKNKAIAIVAAIFVLLVGLGGYAVNVLQNTRNKAENSIILGLDLSGGVSITYRIMTENPSETDISDTIAKLEERAENYSTEYAVYQVGDDRITVEIPGVFDANAVLEELGSPGALYFIAEENDKGNPNYTYNNEIENYELNYELEELIQNGSVILTGDDVKSAEAQFSQDAYGNNIPVVGMTFNDEAAEIFAEATAKAAQDYSTIGIYYNDHFISVPSVEEAITNGECVISGSADYTEAEALATFIRIGAISLKLEELESNVVGAQLGSQAVTTSVKAAAAGLVLVMLFMMVLYRISGFAASIALAIYTFGVVTFVQLFEVTLTLSGIAGIILGIGMAVDANVIIFARIKEEIALGKTVSASINDGYKKAMSAIADGNATTFIAAGVLMAIGSGTVKGFAYTLVISIVLSMFTALFVTKYLMKALFALGFKKESFYGRAKELKTIDFIKHKAIYFTLSLAIIAAGIGGMVYYSAKTGNAFQYGIEFAGGTSTTADFGKTYTIEEIEKEIVPYISRITGDSAVQATTVDNSTEVVLKTRTLTLEEREALDNMLVTQFGVAEETISTQSISSAMSGEMRRSAVISVLAACFFMLVYIRLRFKDLRFAASAILALMHDVLIVLTAYALLRISVGNTLIACVLTIVGYSINDTIVIFDRIRENINGCEKRHGEYVLTPAEWKEIANKSLTQTLSRSINTSVTTFIMIFMLFVLGVPAIREFALPLMIGVVFGSYSSIFLAAELWYVMKTVKIGKKAS